MRQSDSMRRSPPGRRVRILQAVYGFERCDHEATHSAIAMTGPLRRFVISVLFRSGFEKDLSFGSGGSRLACHEVRVPGVRTAGERRQRSRLPSDARCRAADAIRVRRLRIGATMFRSGVFEKDLSAREWCDCRGMMPDRRVLACERCRWPEVRQIGFRRGALDAGGGLQPHRDVPAVKHAPVRP